MGSYWHFVKIVRMILHLFFGNIIVAAVQSMGWRKKKPETGNQLGSYCHSQVRANKDQVRAVVMRMRGRQKM